MLSFYKERIANESDLGTATERLSRAPTTRSATVREGDSLSVPLARESLLLADQKGPEVDYDGLVRPVLRGDREFESPSLQRRVRLSPASGFEGREPRLSARVCAAGLATGSAETRRAFHFAPTGGNISAGPYSSTGVPLMWAARMLSWSQRSRAFSGFRVRIDLGIRIGLKQSRAWPSDRARQAADVSARGASLPSNRAAAAHRGWLG